MKNNIRFNNLLYVNQILILAIIFYLLIFHISCSDTISDTGGGIEAGNSILAIQVINNTELLNVEILPNSFFAADQELDSFSIIDSFYGGTLKEIVLPPDEYSVLITDSSSGKQCLIQDVSIINNQTDTITCSLSINGTLKIINNDTNWISGTYLFIPGTSLHYNLKQDNDTIIWDLPVSIIDSILIVYPENEDSVDILASNAIITSAKITTINKVQTDVILNNSASRFNKITIDKEYQNIWIGCITDGDNSDNLFEYKNTTKTWKSYSNTEASELSKGVTALNSNLDGTIYIGTPDGLVTLDDNTFKFDKVLPSDTNYINSITIDSKDTTWIAYSTFICKDNTVFNKTILNSNTIVKRLSNEIWVGTSSNGIYKLDNSLNVISQFTMNNSNLVNDTILSACVDNSDNLWFATTKGLITYDLNNWNTYEQFSDSFKIIEIKCNSVTGEVWFISKDHKLFKIESEELTQIDYGFENFDNNAELIDFAISKDSEIWLLVKNIGIIKIIS